MTEIEGVKLTQDNFCGFYGNPCKQFNVALSIDTPDCGFVDKDKGPNGEFTYYNFLGKLVSPPDVKYTVAMWLTVAEDSPTWKVQPTELLTYGSLSDNFYAGFFEFGITETGKLAVITYAGGSFGFGEESNTAITQGVRTHVAFVKDGLKGTFYINGVDAGSITAAFEVALAGHDVLLGTLAQNLLAAVNYGTFYGKLEKVVMLKDGTALVDGSVNTLISLGVCEMRLLSMSASKGYTLGSTTPSIPLANVANPIGNKFTISLWITFTQLGTNWFPEEIVTFGDVNTAYFQLGAFSRWGYLYFQDSDGKGYGFGGAAKFYSSKVTIPKGVRTHVAFVRDRKSGTFYINGVEAGTILADKDITYVGQSGVLGKQSSTSQFYGKVENVLILNNALRPNEIKAVKDAVDYVCY
jgi:hypothetical protein